MVEKLCLFDEPWVGRCQNSAVGGICCDKHAEEKCQVCGEQATTRCQASRGFMCGIPLCHLCGAGEMCLYHAGRGPLLALKSVLGAGPEPTVFSSIESLKKRAEEMKKIRDKLTSMELAPTMETFDKQVLEEESK